MQGRPEIIDLLNEVLTAELTAVNQYFGHAKMQKNWGFERLADRAYHESIDEMKHAESLIERILYLDGLPNLQRLGSVRLGEDPIEQLRLDLEPEREAVERFNRGIALSVELGDNGTRELLGRHAHVRGGARRLARDPARRRRAAGRAAATSANS